MRNDRQRLAGLVAKAKEWFGISATPEELPAPPASLALIPDRHRAALRAYFLDGLTKEEACAIGGISIEEFSQAREKLREQYRQQQAKAEPGPGSTPCAARPCVLIVENDSTTLLRLVDIVESCELEAHAAATVRGALDKVSRAEYCLVLLNCLLPDGHGAEVAEFVRSRRSQRRTGIIALSADESRDNIGRIMKAGADHFLSKPVLQAELRAWVRQYCSLSSWEALPGLDVDLENLR